MAFSEPKPGLVIRYSFLWPDKADEGHEEGAKDRACAVVIATEDKEILVVPITHTEPDRARNAVLLPTATATRLGLDDEKPSWIITDCLNQFNWPGPDIRPLSSGDIAYGSLPEALTKNVRAAVLLNDKLGPSRVINRTE